MEGLTALINDYENWRLLKGIQVARGAPFLTNMFFADDSFISFQTNRSQAEHVINLLNTFQKASGQRINVDKSSIFFDRNTQGGTKQELWNLLQFREADENIRYLGLPIEYYGM